MLCLATMCQKALLYDIYEDRLMKTIEVGMEIVAVSFENREIGKELERMFDSQA